MNPEEILLQLEKIARDSGQYDKFKDLLSYVNACFDPATETHLISIDNLPRVFLRHGLSSYTKDKQTYYRLLEECTAHLESVGYVREGLYFSLQEHHICGGTADEINNNSPYKPIGINEGKITLEKARKARELSKFGGAFNYLYGLGIERDIIRVTLEPLDENGNTIRDPQPLDKEFNPITNYKKSEKFPFRRL